MTNLSRSSQHRKRSPVDRGFTLIELLVVIGIMCLLMGMLYPAVMTLQRSGDRNASRALVQAVVIAIQNYEPKTLTLSGPEQIRRMWNVDQSTGDTRLDDDPAIAAYTNEQGQVENTALRTLKTANRLPTWYSGFAAMAPMNLPDWSYDPTTRRVTDRWSGTLHILYATDIYGKEGVGVWSAGRDGRTGSGASSEAKDDICSWRGSRTGQQD
jgi:prepilin-type N-terminal cleavage/methylation domain-containing protein